MFKTAHLRARYDAEADVLYLNRGQEIAVRGVEDAEGIVWRYRNDGVLIGATLVDFLSLRRALGIETLNQTVSLRFDLTPEEAGQALAEAVALIDHD